MFMSSLLNSFFLNSYANFHANHDKCETYFFNVLTASIVCNNTKSLQYVVLNYVYFSNFNIIILNWYTSVNAKM